MNIQLIRILSTLFVINLCFVLILAPSFVLIFNEAFYQKEFQKLDVYEHLNQYDVDRINSEVLFFLQPFSKSKLDETFFTQREIDHFVDVKDMLFILFIVLLLNLTLLLVCLIWLSVIFRRRIMILYKKIFKLCCYSSLFVILFAILFSLIVLFSFSFAFQLFHELFFVGDSYLFNPTIEKIVVLYPFQLFFDGFVAIFVFVVLSSAITFALSFFVLKYFFQTNFFVICVKKLRRRNT